MANSHIAYATQTAQYSYINQPQGPPSPPMDETSRCSLPSISNLLDLADQGSPTSETSPQSQQSQASIKSETRPNSSHHGHAIVRGGLPPTPPMSSEAAFESYQSPPTKTVSQLPVASNYYFEATPPLSHADAEAHRQHLAASQPRVPVPTAYAQTGYAPAAYPMAAAPVQPYYGAMHSTPPPQPQISGLYYQRPLPQMFPPLPVTVGIPNGPNPWQHHHYISPSSAASFPQSQDRYICQTCNKAFSRPSSLRIHSHSHTGEKPFKCPHAGCGKAFSVRSNMKRHERGCHNFDSGSTAATALISR